MNSPSTTKSLLKDILLRWIDLCKKEWGDNFVAAIQFGSTTKNIIKHESDVDLLLVFNELPKSKWERFQFLKDKEVELENELKTVPQHHLFPSVLCWEKEKFEKLHPLYLDFVDYSIILYDPQKLAEKIILKTKNWLIERGAVKVQKGQLWYWNVNPRNEEEFNWSFE